MSKISKTQIFTLIVLFEVGSTTLFAVGIKAKQDAWLAILIAMVIGWGILWMYNFIQQTYPDQHLGNILVTVLGKGLGSVLVFFYALYFLVNTSFNFWEFGEVTVLLALKETPLEVVLLVSLLLMLYASYLGIAIIARASEIFIPYFLSFIALIFCFVLLSGDVETARLQPVLEHGIMPVIHAAIPKVVSFPFGEVVVFLFLWHNVKEKKGLFKTSFAAITMSGIILTCSLFLIITTLGPESAAQRTVPLRRVTSMINIGDFIKNIDALALMTFFIGGFFKMTLNFYACIVLIQTLFPIKKMRWILFPLGICLFGFSLAIFPSIIFQRWLGAEVHSTYVHPLFQVIIPSLLLLVIWIKKIKT
ncbi:GerAB/ArcD/ProY family transporter [Bacillus taeanensis]|uniref:Spore gernimation protein n=1 Tax=Bacillus taeanensis TaxID=273032 RepID=A0A366XSL9_9BACI|nr:GerAB/ArcD/ProY family transporter [Bacillus taeanensis]RBW68676.1 spore gernimation protein [Bacillus taeanensis]